MKDSTKLANEVLNYLQSDHPKKLFPRFNGPQLTCIGAALTRKLTMIQGPPGMCLSSSSFETNPIACFTQTTFNNVFHRHSFKALEKQLLQRRLPLVLCINAEVYLPITKY